MKNVGQAVILAGGLGTRLKPYTDDNPKPMFPINGIPYIEYLVKQIKSFGIANIIILLGYLPEKIMNYLGDGKNYGLNITYDVTPIEFDTGARLRHAKECIKEEFLLLYCDNFCPIDWSEKLRRFRYENSLIQITAYANKDNYTRNNILFNNNYVEKYDKSREDNGLNAVDIGYAIVKKEVLNLLSNANVNFEKEIYSDLLEKKKLTVYVTEHRYYSIGSWERIELTKEFFKTKKAVFLDRDGTLNVKPPKACYVEKKEEFIWLDGAKEAIKLLKEKGYMVFLFTNQPGISQGRLSVDTLDGIHQKMNFDLNKAGTAIDKIYYCPHGWDDGCECRKPKPGMLYQAQKEFSLNLFDCIVIGDDIRDIEAGKAAGCKTYLVDDLRDLYSIVNEIITE